MPHTQAHGVTDHQSSGILPQDHGLVAWAGDPLVLGNGVAITPTAGVLNLVKMHVRAAATVTNYYVGISTGGTGATALANCFLGLYTSAGSLVASSGSADQSSGFASTGLKTVATGGSLSLSSGFYWVALLIGTQSTTNVVFRGPGAGNGIINAGLSNATSRMGTILTGQTSLPASFTPSSISQTNTEWAAIG